MNTDKITAEEMVIIDRLKQMKMSGMAEAYEEHEYSGLRDTSVRAFRNRYSGK